MEDNIIKVVWVCRLSNKELREKLSFKKNMFSSYRKKTMVDRAQWNTNAIKEFQKFKDVELHIISPHLGISSQLQEFSHEGIHYHIFRPEEDYFSFKLKRKLFKGKYETPDYDKNSNIIITLIDLIKPDLIHYIGAENPEFSSAALKVNKKYPQILSLQTLMCDPNFKTNYPISNKIYNYRKTIEVEIIKKVDFVCCANKHFKEIIQNKISDKIRFLNLPLAVGETINTKESEKQYDFVYFAININKAADWAIEAFAKAHKKKGGITLNIVGGYELEFKKQLDIRLEELNISEQVTFSGSLPTHNDVIKQIRKSRFAILPLKIDLISGTIREAMANGLPVVTTITPGTPKLNEKRKSVLLSEKGDFDCMAKNMMALLESKDLETKLRNNGYETIKERYDNAYIIKCWHNTYFEIMSHIHRGSPISLETTKNQ